MSLGRPAYWASGERRRGLCSTALPANDVERGCSLAFVVLVDHLPWTAEPLKPHRCPSRSAWHSIAGEMSLTDKVIDQIGVSVHAVTDNTAVWQGLPQGAVQDLTGLVGAQLFATMIWRM
jgi:hypothetical protein